MQRFGWLGPGVIALGLFAYGPCAGAQLFWSADPYKTETRVSPAPHRVWEAERPLPPVPQPGTAPVPTSAVPLTLPELTEYALRNNPRARQAWFAARAAAAGVGVEEADLLPQITGGASFLRIRPVSGTTGTLSPPQTRYGPTLSLSYVLYDFGARRDQVHAAEYRLLAANLNQNRVLQD